MPETMTPRLEVLPLDSIVPNPDQPRMLAEDGSLDALADSIRELGVLQPVVVVPALDAPGSFILVAGHRRTAASRLAELAEIPALVVPDLDRADQVARLMAENTARADLRPLEEARGDATMLSLGFDITTIAKVTAQPKARVTSLLAAGALLKDVDVPPQTSFDELEVLAEFADDQETVARLTEALGNGQFPHIAASARIERARAEKLAKAVEEVRLAGATLYAGQGWGHDPDGTAVKVDASKAIPLSGLEVDPEQHYQCPGHAAAIDRWNGKITWACLDAKLYKHKAKKLAGNSAQSEADRKAREAQRALQEQMEAAETVRDEAIVKLCAKKLPVVCDVIEDMMRDGLYVRAEDAEVAGALHGVAFITAYILLSMRPFYVNWQGEVKVMGEPKSAVALYDLLKEHGGYTLAEIEQTAYDLAIAETKEEAA